MSDFWKNVGKKKVQLFDSEMEIKKKKQAQEKPKPKSAPKKTEEEFSWKELGKKKVKLFND